MNKVIEIAVYVSVFAVLFLVRGRTPDATPEKTVSPPPMASENNEVIAPKTDLPPPDQTHEPQAVANVPTIEPPEDVDRVIYNPYTFKEEPELVLDALDDTVGTLPETVVDAIGSDKIENVVKFEGDKPMRLNSSEVNTSTLTVENYSISFVNSATNSFSDAIKVADEMPGDAELKILRDSHTNANGKDPTAKGYGFLILANDAGSEYGRRLCHEYKKVYDENGWAYQHACVVNTSRQHRLGFLNHANKKELAAVIDEFCYVDDPKNGDAIVKWTLTKEGQTRLAEARFNALIGSGYTHEINFAGHHGNRGYYGTTFDGKREIDIAFELFATTWEHFESAGQEMAIAEAEMNLDDAYDPFAGETGGYLIYASNRYYHPRLGWRTKPTPKPKTSSKRYNYAKKRSYGSSSRSYSSRSSSRYKPKTYSSRSSSSSRSYSSRSSSSRSSSYRSSSSRSRSSSSGST